MQGHNITLELLGPGGTNWIVREQIISALIPDRLCVALIGALFVVSAVVERLRATRVHAGGVQATQSEQTSAREVDRTRAKNLSL